MKSIAMVGAALTVTALLSASEADARISFNTLATNRISFNNIAANRLIGDGTFSGVSVVELPNGIRYTY